MFFPQAADILIAALQIYINFNKLQNLLSPVPQDYHYKNYRGRLRWSE